MLQPKTIMLLVVVLLAPSCGQQVSMIALDTTAEGIFADEIAINADGSFSLDPRINVVDDIGYVSNLSDGTKLVLFQTWRGKGSNLRGLMYSNGPALAIGSEIEVQAWQPTGPGGGPTIGAVEVMIDAVVSKTCYRVSRTLD